MSGFICLHRGWRDCDVFGDEPMTEREAWVWLLEKAVWKACVRRNAKGERVQLDRGQFHTSLRTLGDQWGWGKNKVARYLERLEEHGMIGTVAGQSGCIITVCNYDKYQVVRDSQEADDGTASGQSRDTQEENKPLTSEPKGSSVTNIAPEKPKDAAGHRLAKDFVMPVEWVEWAKSERDWSEKDTRSEAANFIDFWHAKAGKDARKTDWLATWRTWVRSSRRANGQQGRGGGSASQPKTLAEQILERRQAHAA